MALFSKIVLMAQLKQRVRIFNEWKAIVIHMQGYIHEEEVVAPQIIDINLLDRSFFFLVMFEKLLCFF